mmetsp:Transcript_20875/g.63632  ORF Transcript_20875/g.63632 Transcript_20875/m.63632 type:complete len:204 (-) Transcript_20875:776-1387(-)
MLRFLLRASLSRLPHTHYEPKPVFFLGFALRARIFFRSFMEILPPGDFFRAGFSSKLGSSVAWGGKKRRGVRGVPSDSGTTESSSPSYPENEGEGLALDLGDLRVPHAQQEHKAVLVGVVLGRVDEARVHEDGLPVLPVLLLLADLDPAVASGSVEAEVGREDEVGEVGVRLDAGARRLQEGHGQPDSLCRRTPALKVRRVAA